MASWDNNKKILKFENLLEQYYKVEKEMEDLIEEYNNSCNKFIYKEMWRGIDGYDNYMVSSYGRVKNIKTGRILQPCDNRGYSRLLLYKDKQPINMIIHRLVAQAFLLNPGERSLVDHVDGDCKNNNMTNLRWASHTENMQNRKINKNNTANFKGVSFHKRQQKYIARIGNKCKLLHIGTFETAIEASKAYEVKAKELFGKFYKPSQ